ncbi:hypothetical protein Spb1_17590 [Planctopirus ephydatiae]|uniref:Lysozyme inhibitor LprI-like N-terminal domain-containing protein n=1 Tax=Planctopirus ephydatiae TaxID=2528019 RepID=A0A518GN21_9PLAN|nr:lysozyme inhibitor LprI family protein [Planctopirus ephydatiae]QDV29841.1 hypothetical protein Spb1_17590 [Planctopirus ephydatiae]
MQTKLHYAVLMAMVLTSALRADDAKLRDLEAHLQSALTQIEMNIASGQIAEYLDKKLVEKERDVAKDLDPEALRLFSEASKLWRDYRSAQTTFEADLYRGGSIRPLVHNRTYSRLTQERLSALEGVTKP